jgi:hypothetical protein
MAIGQEINNVTLVPNVESVLQFTAFQQTADVINNGPGIIFLSWRKAATVSDVNCLQIVSGGTYKIRSKMPWQTLSIISPVVSTVQVIASVIN